MSKHADCTQTRHQDGDTEPLLLDEILDETNQLDVSASIRHWLATEALASSHVRPESRSSQCKLLLKALLNNPKIDLIDTSEGRKFAFKPKLDIRDRKGLLRLLKNYDLAGKGGILMEDVEESLPRAEKAVKALGDNVVIVTRPTDKKRVLFYNDKIVKFAIDEVSKLWRSVAVEGMDEEKIEEYLTRNGITSMQDAGVRKVTPVPRRKKGGSKKNRQFKRHNDHLEDVLKDYSELTNKT
nr:hypothetical protein BaRGS_002699 [Batillaria attramentaria]